MIDLVPTIFRSSWQLLLLWFFLDTKEQPLWVVFFPISLEKCMSWWVSDKNFNQIKICSGNIRKLTAYIVHVFAHFHFLFDDDLCIKQCRTLPRTLKSSPDWVIALFVLKIFFNPNKIITLTVIVCLTCLQLGPLRRKKKQLCAMEQSQISAITG